MVHSIPYLDATGRRRYKSLVLHTTNLFQLRAYVNDLLAAFDGDADGRSALVTFEAAASDAIRHAYDAADLLRTRPPNYVELVIANAEIGVDKAAHLEQLGMRIPELRAQYEAEWRIGGARWVAQCRVSARSTVVGLVQMLSSLLPWN